VADEKTIFRVGIADVGDVLAGTTKMLAAFAPLTFGNVAIDATVLTVTIRDGGVDR